MATVEDLEAARARRWRRARIAALVAAHVAGGAFVVLAPRVMALPYGVARFLSAHSLEIYLSIILSQAGLLGIWLGLTETPWKNRLLDGALGAAYLAVVTYWFVPPFVPEVGRIFYTVVSLAPCAGAALLLRLIRRQRSLAVVIADANSGPGLQFSIRHLLVLTAVFALLLGMKPKSVPPALLASLVFMAALVLWAVCIILGSVWAALTEGPAGARAAVVLLLAALTGGTPAYYVGMKPDDLVAMIVVSCAQAVLVTGSLLVLRRLGYRLVRRQWRSP